MADELIAAKGTLGNPSLASVFMMQPVHDPVLQALRISNAQVTTQFVPWVSPQSPMPPSDDRQTYLDRSLQLKLCMPFLRVQELGPPLPSPAVRFERQEDGLHLRVTLEEDPSKRQAGALPFSVTAKWGYLKYGQAPDQVLKFDTLLQEPLPPTDPPGPAFRIVAAAKVPDEHVEVLVQALQTADAAIWGIHMEFPWVWGSWMMTDFFGPLGGLIFPRSASSSGCSQRTIRWKPAAIGRSSRRSSTTMPRCPGATARRGTTCPRRSRTPSIACPMPIGSRWTRSPAGRPFR